MADGNRSDAHTSVESGTLNASEGGAMSHSSDDESGLRQESHGRGSPCPQCRAQLLPIVYGMPAGPVPDVILGGCVIGPDNPSIGCESCGWRGDAADLVVVSHSAIRPGVRSFEVLRAIAEQGDDPDVTNLAETSWLAPARHQISELWEGAKVAAGLAGRVDVPTDLLVDRLLSRVGTDVDDGLAQTLDVISALPNDNDASTDPA